MVLFGYDITLLTGIIAPLMVIIGVPNSILIINSYRFEYAKTQDKMQSLLTTIQQNTLTTFIANLTTAIGFGVLYFTDSSVLLEFGVTAAFGVMFTWLICMVMLLSFYPSSPRLLKKTLLHKAKQLSLPSS